MTCYKIPVDTKLIVFKELWRGLDTRRWSTREVVFADEDLEKFKDRPIGCEPPSDMMYFHLPFPNKFHIRAIGVERDAVVIE